MTSQRATGAGTRDTVRCRAGEFAVSELVRFARVKCRYWRIADEHLDDLSQDALVELASRSETVDDPFAYLTTVTRRLALHHRLTRRARSRRELPLELVLERGTQSGCPIERISQRRVLRSLSRQDVELLLLWAAGGSCKELAALADCSPGTARVRISRLRRKLNATL